MKNILIAILSIAIIATLYLGSCKAKHKDVPPSIQPDYYIILYTDKCDSVVLYSKGGKIFIPEGNYYTYKPCRTVYLKDMKAWSGVEVVKDSSRYETKAAVVVDPFPDSLTKRRDAPAIISPDIMREPWFQLNRPNGKIDSIYFSSIQSVTILYKGEIKTILIDSMKANGSNTWLKPKHKQ